MNSIDIRNSVKKDYDLIADQYFNEYGKVIEDIELVDLFLSYLKKGDQIIDLGGGGGNYSNYFIQNGFKAVCYDFSSNMKKHAAENFSHVPYILDDMLNIKNHYANNSVEAIISMYALFHIPKNDINNF